MDILLHNKKLKIVIGSGLFFPTSDEMKEADLPEDECNINEWQTYFITVYSDNIPDWFQFIQLPEPLLAVPLPKNTRAFNFKNYVGLSRIGPIRLNVINNKIGTDAYNAMLEDIADRYIDLIFSFSESNVGQNYAQSGHFGRNIAYIEYALLKKFLLDQHEGLLAISSVIISDPHKHIRREEVSRSIDTIRFFDPLRLMDALTSGQSIFKLPAGHQLLEAPLSVAIQQLSHQRLFPTDMREEQKILSVDNQENRFVKHFLEDIRNKLEGLKKIISPKSTYLNPDINKNLERMSFQVNALLDNPMWQEVGRMRFIPENSQVLHRRDGYRQLFRLYSLFQLLTRYEFPDAIDFENLLETKDSSTLYEYWCFFQVKQALDQRCQSISKIQKLKQQCNTEAKIAEGSLIEYVNGMQLLFNWTAEPQNDSYSLSYRPDIVIAIQDRKLIFDAKYKGKQHERNGFYGDTGDGTIESWKDEDIGKMHTYRDAIRYVDGAFVLYPGLDKKVYNSFDATYGFQGIGALPLRPDKAGSCKPGQFESLSVLINGFADAYGIE